MDLLTRKNTHFSQIQYKESRVTAGVKYTKHRQPDMNEHDQQM